MSGAQMVTVPFRGANLEAAEADGKVWVSVRRMCEPLEIGFNGQHEKLSDASRAPWAVTRVMRMTGPDGKTYESFCLDLDSVPMWLATIDSSRVAPHLREKIVLFQREAAKALRDHFFGMAPKAPTSFLEALRLAADLEEKRIALVAEVAVLAPKAEFFDQVADSSNTCSLAEAAKALGWGRQRFINKLKAEGIFFQDRPIPTQVHLDAGRFVVVVGTHPRSAGPETHFTTRVTGKGFIYLSERICKKEVKAVSPFDSKEAAE